MIKTARMLLNELTSYTNPRGKIKRMADGGQLTPVTRGLYETNPSTPGHYLAGTLYGPSYLSFEFALAWYGLIPEAVYTYTCATCGKGRKKKYETPFGVYMFRDVPVQAFPYSVDLHAENGYSFMLASPEKAVCDMIYTQSPLANRHDIRNLLFEDLRIDESAFRGLNLDDMTELAGLYRTVNHRLLTTMIREMKRHEQHHRTNAEPA